MSNKHDEIKDKAEKEKDAKAEEAKEKAKSKIPEQPECDPALGDLTPAYIEWVKKYYPDDFEARYKNRIPELTEEPKKEGAPGKEEDDEASERPHPHKKEKHNG